MLIRLLQAAGYEIRRAPARVSLSGALASLRQAGFDPRTVIDVGAARGDFTLAAASVFPDARFLLVEPLEEFAVPLGEVAGMLPSAHVVVAAAAPREGEVTLNVHPDLVGSSLYREEENSDVNGSPRGVPAVTVDGIVVDAGVDGPFLLKVDVQGAERDVLEGAKATLKNTGFVLLELSLFRFFEGAPEFAAMISYMESLGFVPYDIVGLSHRPLDEALAQIDMAFVRSDGPLRRHHHFATPEQRRVLTRRLRR
jgi:FkbM family methyltransferase